MKLLTALLLAATLSGCMSYASTVADRNGNPQQCAFSGYGIIGGAIAKSNYDRCIAAHKAGQ